MRRSNSSLGEMIITNPPAEMLSTMQDWTNKQTFMSASTQASKPPKQPTIYDAEYSKEQLRKFNEQWSLELNMKRPSKYPGSEKHKWQCC